MKKSILILAVFSAFIFTSCKDDASKKVKEENVAAAADRDKNTGKFPVMQFEETVYDFGTIDQGTNVEHRFTFTNTGDAPLVIVDAKSSCGCTVPEKPKDPIAPGKNGQIKVKYDTNRVGPIRKTVTVYSNATEPIKALKIKGEVLDGKSVLEN